MFDISHNIVPFFSTKSIKLQTDMYLQRWTDLSNDLTIPCLDYVLITRNVKSEMDNEA